MVWCYELRIRFRLHGSKPLLFSVPVRVHLSCSMDESSPLTCLQRLVLVLPHPPPLPPVRFLPLLPVVRRELHPHLPPPPPLPLATLSLVTPSSCLPTILLRSRPPPRTSRTPPFRARPLASRTSQHSLGSTRLQRFRRLGRTLLMRPRSSSRLVRNIWSRL